MADDVTAESPVFAGGPPSTYQDDEGTDGQPAGDEPERPDDGVAPDELEYEDDLETDEVEVEAQESSTEGGEPASDAEGAEGARLIALNMALNGTPRDETARYLEENFNLDDQDSILDEVYARVGG